MAAIYDALGNVIGDDGAPSLDQMKLELTKSNRLTPQQMERFVAPPPLASQISGYGKPVPPAQTPPAANPLESAAGNFTQLATNFNPLMMMKSMREAAGILTVPPVAAIKGVGESIFASPPGTYTSGKAPDYAEKVAKQFMEQNAPQTPVTQAFANAISPLMADLPAYLGHLQTGRPALTPNDVRVMGAEATRMGRQVRDIPTDFANAQSGMQRIDPITGQPTYGVKLQGAADSIGDIMAQREMQGLPPIPGLPASMQPMNPKLYAMRPEGSRIQNAVLPPTAPSNAATYTPVQDLISDFVKTEPLSPVEVLDEVQNNILSRERAQPARDAFTNYLKQKANEMYPDAPSEGAALAAYKLKFGNKAASAPNTLDLYYQFLQTPEGIQYRATYNLPSPDEVAARHDAASQWLQSQFANYINEKVGTPNEPAAKLASQGFTFAKPEDVLESSRFSTQNLEAKRTEAGMPAKTATDLARLEAETKLQELTAASAVAENKKREQQAAAIAQGYGAVDPNTGLVAEGMNMGRFEPFAQASREASKAATALAKQQQKYDNLSLGSAYERATDIAISAPTAKNLKEGLEFREQQFYPSLMRTPDDERVYTASVNQLKNLGFDELAKNFYNDVMSGAIPLDKVPKMTVENYIRQVAEKRIASERIAKEQTAKYVSDVNDKFKESADKYIPLDKTYRNVGALEITNKFKPEEVGRLASEITLALDVCIGEGGSAVDTPNYWHPGTGNRQYEPIYNVLTGERNPRATSPRMTFINAVKKGDQMIDFRDLATGVPAAIFQFEKVSPNKFHLGFASGRGNQFVQQQYTDGIKDYLNSRSDQIETTSSNLEKNLSVYDRKRVATPTLAQAANVPTSEFRNLNLNALPRFVTGRDLQEFVANLAAAGPQAPTPTIVDIRPSESTMAYTTSMVSGAIDNVLDAQRRAFEEDGIEDRFQRSEDFFADIRAHFNEALREHGPVPALNMTIQELMGLEGQYSNSTRPSHQLISQGIIDLIQGLDSMEEYITLRAAADDAQARQTPMRQGAPIPEMDAEELLFTYRNQLTPEQARWLLNFSDRWDGPDGSSDVQQAAMTREFALWRDNNRLQPAQRPDYLRMTHDAALQLDRQIGVDAGDEMRSVFRVITEGSGLDPARDTDAFIASLRGAAEVAARGTVEIALNELADLMESEYMRDWEPEVAPAAPAQQAPAQPFDWVGALDSLANEVSQNTNPGIGNRVDTIAHRVAERINPRLDPAGYAAALRAVDFTNEHVAVGPALRQLALAVEASIVEQPPAQAQQPQNIVPRGNDIDPEELRDAFLSGARVRLDDQNYEIVREHVEGIGQYLNSRESPEEYALMLRQAAGMVLDANAQDLLQSHANQIEQLYGPPTQAQQPTEYRPATQDQASASLAQINREIGNQARLLSDENNEATTQLFATSIGTLYSENNLNEVGDTPASLTRFGYYLQGYRDDLAAQIPYLNREGFMGVAAASAIQNVINAIDTQLVDFRSRPAGDVQTRTEQSLIQEVRDALDNNELGAEDLRRMAGSMEPFVGDPRWGALSEQTRRTAIQQLREMANFVEFSPRDFARQLINEEGPEHYDDAITLLHNNDYDHPVLQGLPSTERGRAAQGTALAMQRILDDETQLRALNPNGVPPAPAVTLSRNIDPVTATFINDFIANARTVMDEGAVASVLRKINETAAYEDARNNPAGFAIGLRLAADDAISPIVETALQELADHFAHRAPPSAADLANQRNDRLMEAENALNDPEVDPEYLNLAARAMEGNINPYWNALAADERRVLAQRFRQRAMQRNMGEQAQVPAPRAITRQQQRMAERVPQITDMLIDFSVDDPIETAADYRRIANILRDRRNSREFLENVMGVGDSLGDFTLRASDLRSNALSLVADELESRADNLVPAPVGPLMTDNDLYNVFADIIRTAIRDEDFEPANYTHADLAMLVADDQIGGLDDLTPDQRTRLAMIVRERGFGGNANANIARAEDMRNAAEDLVNSLDEAYYTETPDARAAVRLIRQHLRALRRNGEMAYDNIMGMAADAYEWSPELLAALEIELENLIERYQGMDDYADGGPVRGYKKGGSVEADEQAAFGIYPNAGKRSKKSDIGDKLNASLVPQDALDLATTIAPFGKVGKTLAAAILAGAPAEAQAGNMSSLLKLVAREAPEQFQSIREALLRTFNTGLEHSVVGSTRMGGPSRVVQGVNDSVTPSKLDVVNARRNIDQSGLIDFHTHPRQNNSVSEFKVTPSDADLQTWMTYYGGSRTATTPNEIKTMVGSPFSRQDGVTSAYNFFATNKPNQTLDRRAYDAARYELQRAKPLQSLKDIPEVRQYLDTGGTLGDVLSAASPMVLQKLYAQKGLGRHDMRLSNAPVAGPLGSESNLFDQIVNPAMEVLDSKKFGSFADGGIVQQNPTTDQMRYELMMRRK